MDRDHASSSSSASMPSNQPARSISIASKGSARIFSIAPCAFELEPWTVLESAHAQGLREGLDVPEVLHAHLGIEMALGHEVVASRALREDLANPIGHDIDRGGHGESRETLAPPSSDIGRKLLRARVLDSRLSQDPPAAWPPRPRSKGPLTSARTWPSTRACGVRGRGKA